MSEIITIPATSVFMREREREIRIYYKDKDGLPNILTVDISQEQAQQIINDLVK